MGQPTPESMKDTTVAAALLNLTVTEEEDIPANWEDPSWVAPPGLSDDLHKQYTVPENYVVVLEEQKVTLTEGMAIFTTKDGLIKGWSETKS